MIWVGVLEWHGLKNITSEPLTYSAMRSGDLAELVTNSSEIKKHICCIIGSVICFFLLKYNYKKITAKGDCFVFYFVVNFSLKYNLLIFIS